MPHFNDVMIIREEQVGEGSPLLFPNMSSCAAVVAQVGATLVGAHFTQDPWIGAGPATGRTAHLLANFTAQIAARPIDSLLIVGFNENHNPANIANALGVPQWDAYDVARKDILELTLIFTHQGSGVPIKVDYKRQSKVTVTSNPRPGVSLAALLREGSPGTAETGTLHTLRKHFVNHT